MKKIKESQKWFNFIYFLMGIGVGLCAFFDIVQIFWGGAKGFWYFYGLIVFYVGFVCVVIYLKSTFSSISRTFKYLLAFYAFLSGILYIYWEGNAFLINDFPHIFEEFNAGAWFGLLLGITPFLFMGLILWDLNKRFKKQ